MFGVLLVTSALIAVAQAAPIMGNMHMRYSLSRRLTAFREACDGRSINLSGFKLLVTLTTRLSSTWQSPSGLRPPARPTDRPTIFDYTQLRHRSAVAASAFGTHSMSSFTRTRARGWNTVCPFSRWKEASGERRDFGSLLLREVPRAHDEVRCVYPVPPESPPPAVSFQLLCVVVVSLL
jgi:hypothetical protein